MLHCFQCGADLPDNLAFCLHCGAKLDDEAPTVVRPGPDDIHDAETIAANVPPRSSGAAKFIVGSLLGAIAVILLLVIGAFVLFSMRNGEHPTNVPVNINNNNAVGSPTPARSPTPKKPTPTPSPSAINDNSEPPTAAKTCTVINPAGGSVNLRRNCDSRDCSMDASTLHTQADPGEDVELTARKPVTTGRFTWVQVKYRGETLWISSTRIDCELP
jgi:hypothetical protein